MTNIPFGKAKLSDAELTSVLLKTVYKIPHFRIIETFELVHPKLGS